MHFSCTFSLVQSCIAFMEFLKNISSETENNVKA